MVFEYISYILALMLIGIWAVIYMRYKTKDHHYYLLVVLAIGIVLIHAIR
jgi:hypothetical protein